MKYDKSLLVFNPRNHSYTYDGERLLGVTTALSVVSKGDAITQWAANQTLEYLKANLPGPEDYPLLVTSDQYKADMELLYLGAKYAWKARRDEAASIGTRTHAWIESYLKGQNPDWPEDPNVRNAAKAALGWIKSVKWETVATEQMIYIPELKVAGTCDWLARINGVLSLVDWKTSKSLHSTYAYQLAAYLHALEEELGEEIRDRWLLRIDKETGIADTPLLLSRESLEADYQAFESAVHLYRRESAIKKEWLNG